MVDTSMVDLLSKFQCPVCKGALAAHSSACTVCGRTYATADGILDFVGGRFATQLDAETYDATNTLEDASSEHGYQQIKRLAGHRWPASLGSVVEIGCGTGTFSRSMIRNRDAVDAVLTDVSPGMLRRCRSNLSRLDNAATVPVCFATYSANEACFRDAVFDACVGASVVHHITDVRAFLGDVWRILKPGGRACFIEPSYRCGRVMAMTFADILAFLLAHDPTLTDGRQALHNLIAEARKGAVLRGDLALLAAIEDKHMFDGEAFEAMALEAGFAGAEALPSSPDPEGRESCNLLLARLGIGEPFAGRVIRLWPSYANRYLPLLNARDASPGYLFWLTKPAWPHTGAAVLRTEPSDPQRSSEAEITGGGMPFRWVLSLLAEATPPGMRVKLHGWCLANSDIKSVRVTIDGIARETPVWLPRADVHLALNRDGGYAVWNSLCCGVDCEWQFTMEQLAAAELSLGIDLMFCDHRFVPIVAGEKLAIGVPFTTGR
jgi:ubiquinone/menaquinone biosynthesis C-methylase UbiE